MAAVNKRSWRKHNLPIMLEYFQDFRDVKQINIGLINIINLRVPQIDSYWLVASLLLGNRALDNYKFPAIFIVRLL